MPYHSITFTDDDGTFNTYDTWRLIPLSRPIILPPETDAVLSYSQNSYKALTFNSSASKELPVYRKGEFSFQFDDRYEFDWATIYMQIVNALHGRIMAITLEDDPTFHYVGIVKVNWDNGNRSEVKVSVECEPFKYKARVTHTVNGASSYTLAADTKFITPAVLRIEPKTNFGEVYFEINGLARHPITETAETIKMKNLTSQCPVTFDGESGLITLGSKNTLSDCDFWEFPTVVPGSNKLTFSSNLTNMTISYKPRYL